MFSDKKSLYSGIIFSALGAFLCVDAWKNLEIGTALRMGPGYFPIMIGGGLLLLGVAVMFSGQDRTTFDLRALPWRAIVLVSAAILVFAYGLRPLGFVPATALMVFIAAKARPETSLQAALLISFALTVFCTLVFIYGLSLPLPLFGSVLGV